MDELVSTLTYHDKMWLFRGGRERIFLHTVLGNGMKTEMNHAARSGNNPWPHMQANARVWEEISDLKVFLVVY